MPLADITNQGCDIIHLIKGAKLISQFVKLCPAQIGMSSMPRNYCCIRVFISDSTTSHIEELSETYGKVCDDIPEENDFDSLLRMCQEGLGR